jgi:hypothetical protein
VIVARPGQTSGRRDRGINDLDISYVKDGGGTTRGSSTRVDDNVEFVRITNTTYATGTWTVRVYGWSIASAQSFGLAVNPILRTADLSINGTVEYVGLPATSVNRGNTFFFHQYVSNSGYAAGGTRPPFRTGGFAVEGARIYTADGISL